MNLVRGFVLVKELFGTFESFDANEAKSKKLSEDLKAMSLEKAQPESKKMALHFKLDLVVTKDADMKAKYEIELKKRVEEAQKLAEDRTLTAETALATTNSSLETVVTEKEKSLAAAKQELERVRAERTDTEAKAVETYRDSFVDTPEYQNFAQGLMTIGGEQLVEQIMETHPEWDISFLHLAPTEVPTSEAVPGDKRDGAEDQTTLVFVEEGLQCADL
ncbi:hypothetical protein Adt_11477 [Abeliophyllum distichum]|uniref:Uncharacterized protein n=1 Tax=Abeliophyllum distichum TaxID=126358 RepID=A0ABD1UMY9_9LAMI